MTKMGRLLINSQTRGTSFLEGGPHRFLKRGSVVGIFLITMVLLKRLKSHRSFSLPSLNQD